MPFFERSTALSVASRIQAHEGAIASRTVPHASGESHSHVQHLTALVALQAHWEEIGLTGESIWLHIGIPDFHLSLLFRLSEKPNAQRASTVISLRGSPSSQCGRLDGADHGPAARVKSNGLFYWRLRHLPGNLVKELLSLGSHLTCPIITRFPNPSDALKLDKDRTDNLPARLGKVARSCTVVLPTTIPVPKIVN
jgi:hypothetical protein